MFQIKRRRLSVIVAQQEEEPPQSPKRIKHNTDTGFPGRPCWSFASANSDGQSSSQKQNRAVSPRSNNEQKSDFFHFNNENKKVQPPGGDSDFDIVELDKDDFFATPGKPQADPWKEKVVNDEPTPTIELDDDEDQPLRIPENTRNYFAVERELKEECVSEEPQSVLPISPDQSSQTLEASSLAEPTEQQNSDVINEDTTPHPPTPEASPEPHNEHHLPSASEEIEELRNKLAQQANNHGEALQKLHSIIEDLSLRESIWVNRLLDARAEDKKLRAMILGRDEELASKVFTISNLEKELSKTHSTNQDLCTQVLEHQHLSSQHADQASPSTQEHRVKEQRLNETITGLTGRIETLKQQLLEAQSRDERLTGRVVSLKTRNSNLETQVQELSGAKENLENQVADLNKAKAKLEKKVERLTEGKKSLERQVRDLTKGKGKLEGKNRGLKEDILTTLEKEISGPRTRREELDHHVQSLEADLKHAHDSNASLQSKLDSSKETSENLASEIQILNESLKTRNKNIASLDHSLASSKHNEKELETRYVARGEKMKVLKENLEHLRYNNLTWKVAVVILNGFCKGIGHQWAEIWDYSKETARRWLTRCRDRETSEQSKEREDEQMRRAKRDNRRVLETRTASKHETGSEKNKGTKGWTELAKAAPSSWLYPSAMELGRLGESALPKRHGEPWEDVVDRVSRECTEVDSGASSAAAGMEWGKKGPARGVYMGPDTGAMGGDTQETSTHISRPASNGERLGPMGGWVGECE